MFVPVFHLANHAHVWLHPRDWRLLPWYTKLTCRSGCCVDRTFTFLFYAYTSSERNYTLLDLAALRNGEDSHAEKKEGGHGHLH